MKIFEQFKNAEKFAHDNSEAFCYNCYKVVPKDINGKTFCSECGSDDLMRFIAGVGTEYGYEWISEHLIEENLNAINEDDEYEENMRSLYTDTVSICGYDYDPVDTLKYLDPIAWRCGRFDWLDFMINDDELVEINDKYYRFYDVEEFFEKIA